MRFKIVVANLLALGMAQWVEPSPTTADPGTIHDCTWWHVATSSDTCDTITAAYGLTQDQPFSYLSREASSFSIFAWLTLFWCKTLC